MTFSRGLVSVVIRAAAFALLAVVALALSNLADSDDGLGAGLLFFLVAAVVALAWALFDATRRGFVPAAGLWLVTSVLTSVALSVVFTVANDEPSLGAEI